MGGRISAWLCRVSRGWVACIALAVFLLFSALALPGQSAQAARASGGAGSPDTTLFYAPARLYELAERYGADGRQAYVRARWTFDLAFPLVYTFFLATNISWVGSRAFPPGSRWRLLNLTPVLAMAFDYGENLATSIVMFRYPLRTPGVDLLAPALTSLKWLFVGGSFVVLAAVAVAWVRRR